MRAPIFALVLLTLSLVTGLSAPAEASNTHRCRDGVISVGSSSVGDVVKRCGRADRIVPLQNVYGAGVGERWEYYLDNKTVMVTIKGGVVARIDEV